MHTRVTYDEQGFVAPLDVASSELDAMNSELRTIDRIFDLSRNYRTKTNVLYRAVHEFSKSKKVVDVVRQILGEDFHCWDALVWLKRAGDNRLVSPHQDGTYWNFQPRSNACTLWVPLQDVGAHNGSIRYVVGSHKEQIEHADVRSERNLLYRGQTAIGDFKYESPLELQYGQASLHHPFNVHSSDPNVSTEDRYAINFLFVSSHCEPILKEPREFTMHVHGKQSNNWLYSPEPSQVSNFDAWESAHKAQRENYLKLK